MIDINSVRLSYYKKMVEAVEYIQKHNSYINRFNQEVYIYSDFICFCIVDETYLCAHVENDFEVLFPIIYKNGKAVELSMPIDPFKYSYIREIDIDSFDPLIYTKETEYDI